jgi:hypothetical protein
MTDERNLLALSLVDAEAACLEDKLGFRADEPTRAAVAAKVRTLALDELVKAAVAARWKGGPA